MSIEKFIQDWSKLALGTSQVPTLTTEVMYDWKAVNEFCAAHPELDEEALKTAIRGGFRPIYPVGIGDGDWKPADQPISMGCSFDYEAFQRQHQVQAVGHQRMVERRTDQGWRVTEMSAIKKGDEFRMFDPDGNPVKLNGSTLLRAAEDASCVNSVWGVQADPLFELSLPAGAGCGDGVTGD